MNNVHDQLRKYLFKIATAMCIFPSWSSPSAMNMSLNQKIGSFHLKLCAGHRVIRDKIAHLARLLHENRRTAPPARIAWNPRSETSHGVAAIDGRKAAGNWMSCGGVAGAPRRCGEAPAPEHHRPRTSSLGMRPGGAGRQKIPARRVGAPEDRINARQGARSLTACGGFGRSDSYFS